MIEEKTSHGRDFLSRISSPNIDKEQIFEALVAEEILVAVAPQIYFHKEHYQSALDRLTGYLKEHPSIALGDFRDLLGTSRKYAVALLEFWDRRGITQKVGDARLVFGVESYLVAAVGDGALELPYDRVPVIGQKD